MNWLKRVLFDPFSRRRTSGVVRAVSLHDPVVISSPRISFLNLKGPSAESIVAEDKAALSPLFTSTETRESNPPFCDVLMVYADIQPSGEIFGYPGGVRDMIRKSRAKIVIFASENVPDSYISAIDQNSGDAKANLVMTLDRKGPAFANFFARLFSEMFKGKTMPMAWVKLAPQDPNDPHENCPETIFAAEISHIVFQ